MAQIPGLGLGWERDGLSTNLPYLIPVSLLAGHSHLRLGRLARASTASPIGEKGSSPLLLPSPPPPTRSGQDAVFMCVLGP